MKTPFSPLPKFCQKPQLWALLWLFWLLVLWQLSGGPQPLEKPGFEIPHFDKLLHAGYFFGGAGLLSPVFLLRSGRLAPLAVLLAQMLVGLSDEIHQSYVPGRTGNSPADLAADLLGTLIGLWVFHKVHRAYFPRPSSEASPPAAGIQQL